MGQGEKSRARGHGVVTAVAIFAALMMGSPEADAAAPDFLLQIPGGSVAPGPDAGKLDNPRGMAADPMTGHLYVSDRENARIDEFTSWGAFVKAWGWDVAPGTVNEEQEVQVSAAAGQFKLTFGAFTSADLPFNANATQVQTALNALPSISPGGGSVSVSGGPGGTNGGTPYIVSFDGGPLVGTNVAQLIASNGTTPLSGGSPFSGVRVGTRANGTPGGTGLEACTAASGCKAGIKGSGAGQINAVWGVAVDAEGSIYLQENPFEGENHRVQKFDSAGNFLLMFGGDVNKTTGSDVCTKADIEGGDTCGNGLIGTTDGWFSNIKVGNYLAYSPGTDSIFVGDVDRIQEFEPNGSFKGKFDFEGLLDGESVRALAVDPTTGHLYFAVSGMANVHKFDPATEEVDLDALEVDDPGRGLAVDAAGSVYVIRGSGFNQGEILGFDSSGEPIEGMEVGDGFAAGPAGVGLNGLATNVLGPGSEAPGDLYVDYFRSGSGAVSYVNAYGPSPIAFEDPPKAPPQIHAQYAASVGTDAAVLKAQINPFFWTDTTFYVEYGTGPCSEGGCTEVPVPPGVLLTSKSTNAPVTTAGILLEDLQPGTTYHYRFVAQSSGGGPVTGQEQSFTTFRVPDPPNTNCPNQAFRTGASAKLPDCRAYELVSPLEKNNADVLAQNNGSKYPSALSQSTPSGGKMTYSSGTAFGDPGSTPYTSQYLAERHSSGWLSEGLAPPRTRLVLSILNPTLDNEFKIFSADLCHAWLRTLYDPPLAAGAVELFPNLYRRQNCAPGKDGFEALTTVAPPPEIEPNDYVSLQVQGASADGTHSVFIAPVNLTPDAPPNTNDYPQLYEHSEGQPLRFICILPNGTASEKACYAGTADEAIGGTTRAGSFHNAVSANGDRIFWTETASVTDEPGPGRIYVRFAGEPKSRRVSQSVAAAAARFWGASPDGAKAIFGFEDGASLQNGNLYSFDVAADKPTLIAGGVIGVMGISEDSSRVYFASTKVLTGEEENSEGDKAQLGATNLYLWEEGEGGGEATYSFVATLGSQDVLNLSPIHSLPFSRVSRVSPDGGHAAFMSRASLTGYDNSDVASEAADAEVFLYDAAEAELRCASCNPSGARPSGRKLLSVVTEGENYWFAARIPAWQWPHYASRALSDDGKRLFFESAEALSRRDTDGTQDVYQWEEAGSGDCDPSDSSFVADSEGCIELISSGESARDASFLDASATGDDVFFTTLSSLVPPDYGLIDVYDARVGGGFAYPEEEPPCEGEACQSPPAPPQSPTPSTASIEGPGNVKQGRKPRCPKGKRRVVRRGKARCVRKQSKQGKRAQRRRGRAGR